MFIESNVLSTAGLPTTPPPPALFLTHCCVVSSSKTWIKAVRAANIAISKCPVVNGSRAQGLSDVLLLISEAYVALNK
jgi:hypothetical protein